MWFWLCFVETADLRECDLDTLVKGVEEIAQVVRAIVREERVVLVDCEALLDSRLHVGVVRIGLVGHVHATRDRSVGQHVPRRLPSLGQDGYRLSPHAWRERGWKKIAGSPSHLLGSAAQPPKVSQMERPEISTS